MKGNNYMRQLGIPKKLKEKEWTALDISAKLAKGNQAVFTKVEANQGQTCALTSDGMLWSLGQVLIWGWNFDNRVMSKVAMYYKRYPMLFTLLQVLKTDLANSVARRFAFPEELPSRTFERSSEERARLQRLCSGVGSLAAEER